MIRQLAWAELRHRPGRAALLVVGYALGVAVTIVLLAVGTAMLEQARDPRWVGGGDVLVLPEGTNPEMLRTGGVEALFLRVPQARFLVRDVLEGPRGRAFGVLAASPVVDGRPVELEVRGRRWTALATAEIPSRAAAVGAAPALIAGRWRDTPADRRVVAPTPAERLREMDRLHRPPPAVGGDSTWAEWHYANVVLGRDRWLYVTFLIGGRVGTPGRWGGRLLLTVREPDGRVRRWAHTVPDRAVRFDTTGPDLIFERLGAFRLEDSGYRLDVRLPSARLDLRLEPTPGLAFPPTDLSGDELVSGYVVPMLHGRASGTVCLPRCQAVVHAPAYHDHNWGIWRDVAWDWGAASDGDLALLYGAVRGPAATDRPLFAYLVDRAGPRGVFRASGVQVLAWRSHPAPPGRVPARLAFTDSARGWTVTIDVQAAHITNLGRARAPYFVQMRGVATVARPIGPPRRLPGFFELYLDGDGRPSHRPLSNSER